MPFVDAASAGCRPNLFAALLNSRCLKAAADVRLVILGFGQKGNNTVGAPSGPSAFTLKRPGAAFGSRKMQWVKVSRHRLG
jgi:hypothetical protein